MPNLRNSPIIRITSALALVLSLAVIVSLPLVNWFLGRHYLITSLQSEAVFYSSFASNLISANPDYWRYEKLRLEEFLARHPFEAHSETRRIVDLEGRTVASSPEKVAPPSMARTGDIYDSGKVVARFVIERSLRPLMAKTFEAGLLGLLIGSAIYVSMRLFPLRTISNALQSLYEEKERFGAIFESALTGVAVLDGEGRIMRANRAYHRLLHYDDGELIGKNYRDITYHEDAEKNMMLFEEMVEGGIPSFHMEKRYVLKEGDPLWTNVAVYAIRDAKGRFKYCFAMMVDISQRKELEQKLAHNAFHDALTNLPNRALFMDRLNLCFIRCSRHKDYDFAVLFFDLDRFKNVNDSLGHVLGDQMLIEVSRRLRKCLRPYDTVARLGGDEFAILLDDVKTREDATRVAERIHSEMVPPFGLGAHEVFSSASIGIALSSPAYERPEHMLRNADIAMYQAKSLGRACHVVFDEEMHGRATWFMQIDNNLRGALDKDELRLHYQPIVSLQTGRITGFEALLRWQSRAGLIPPADFIPIAEESGLIVPIGDWVLGEACRQLRRWQEEFPSDPPLTVSVNISGRQFTADLAGRVSRALTGAGLHADSLRLEVTEGVIMENPSTAGVLLGRLKDMGIKVHIDDFGTGYSSLSYLHNFAFDALKVDRSFIKFIGADDGTLEIVRTVMSLARNLNMEVIAEGVETPEQLEELRKLGCHYFQGYLFSRPLEAAAAQDLLARKRCLDATGAALRTPAEEGP